MKFKITTYWKCQLIGWGAVCFFVYLRNLASPQGVGFLQRSLIIAAFGLVFSHVLRLLIKRLKILNKKIALQIMYLLFLNAGVSLLATMLFVLILEITGVRAKNGVPHFPFFSMVVILFYEVMIITTGWVAIYYLVHFIRGVRKAEEEKARLKIQLIEAEAQSLRAQMNPHFIYNCMNSIKALIQNDDKTRSIEYLTTFSKLIRTLFQNSDKRQISLYDEIETCRLYTQLEAMRLNGKLKYGFCIDPNLDLKSVMVPALILQPFIENAVWHGIVPKDGGTVNITIKGDGEAIICEVDDDGIGREISKLNNPKAPPVHESKGIHLSQERLNLEKKLNDTNASIQVEDKYNSNIATGTKVILRFNLN